MVTKEAIDSHVSYERRMLALVGDPNYIGGTKCEVIVALADERDHLAAQVAELVALLRNVNLKGSSVEGAEEWDERRRALLARIGATP